MNNMNFQAIKAHLESHVAMGLGQHIGFTREMWEAADDLDIDRLNAEIIRVHEAEAAEWGRCLETQPHSPEWTSHVYSWVLEAHEFLNTEPPVFTIPDSWGVNALQLWSRYQAHKARIARAA